MVLSLALCTLILHVSIYRGATFCEPLLRIGETLIPKGTPLMALTATASVSLRSQLSRILGMKAPIAIVLPPCKQTTKY